MKFKYETSLVHLVLILDRGDELSKLIAFIHIPLCMLVYLLAKFAKPETHYLREEKKSVFIYIQQLKVKFISVKINMKQVFTLIDRGDELNKLIPFIHIPLCIFV